MAAPEKINVLLYEEPLSTGYIGSAWVGEPIGLKGETEYIRTDAFIEKACEWLSKHAKKYYFNKDGHYLGTYELVEDFKLSMEL